MSTGSSAQGSQPLLHVSIDKFAAWLAEHRLYCVTALAQQLCASPAPAYRPTTAATSLLTTTVKPTRGLVNAGQRGVPPIRINVDISIAALQLLAGQCPYETPLLEGAAVNMRCLCEAGVDQALAIDARVGGVVNVYHAAHAAWEPVVEPWVLHLAAAVVPPSAGWGGGLGGAGCAMEVHVPSKVDITLTEVCVLVCWCVACTPPIDAGFGGCVGGNGRHGQHDAKHGQRQDHSG